MMLLDPTPKQIPLYALNHQPCQSTAYGWRDGKSFNSERVIAGTLIRRQADIEMQGLRSDWRRKASQVLSELAWAGAAFQPPSSCTTVKHSFVDGKSPVTQCRLAILPGPKHGEGVLKVEVRNVMPCLGGHAVMQDCKPTHPLSWLIWACLTPGRL